MLDLKIKYNELTAEQFIELWETVWGDGPSLEQTRLAMKHTIFRVSIWDGDCIVAMARMNGDMGLNYYIKDVVVRPEYQGKGIGRILIDELRRFINNNGVKGTDIFVELCAVPDKIPFYEKFGFEANEAQRLKIFSSCRVILKFQFANLPFERGEILFSKGFFYLYGYSQTTR